MPADTPLVSIIIPTFNRAHLIGETLDSVLAQTYHNWECIVVDDGSIDNTEEVLDSYLAKDSRFQFHHRPKNRLPGGNAARNYGFEVSKGEYIQWFDDDDIMLPEYLSFRLPFVNDKIVVLICEGYVVNENLIIEKQIHLDPSVNIYKEYALWRFQMYTPSVMFKRNFLDADLFNEAIRRGQETEFFTRVFYTVPKSKYLVINKPLFQYRQHVNNKTEQAKKYNSKFRDDLLYILQSNFKRALQLGDEDLIYFYYKRLIKQFFKSIRNNHFQNSRKTIYVLFKELDNRNLLLKTKLLGYGGLYVIFKRGYTLQSKLLKHKLKF